MKIKIAWVFVAKFKRNNILLLFSFFPLTKLLFFSTSNKRLKAVLLSNGLYTANLHAKIADRPTTATTCSESRRAGRRVAFVSVGTDPHFFFRSGNKKSRFRYCTREVVPRLSLQPFRLLSKSNRCAAPPREDQFFLSSDGFTCL